MYAIYEHVSFLTGVNNSWILYIKDRDSCWEFKEFVQETILIVKNFSRLPETPISFLPVFLTGDSVTDHITHFIHAWLFKTCRRPVIQKQWN